MNEIEKKLSDFKANLISALAKYHRPPNSVKLLAASKGQPFEKIKLAIAAGQKIFGENYVQEALPKIMSVDPAIEWHFQGNIQSNKTKQIAEHFSWVQSVADKRIAKRLNDQRPKELPLLNICIEVNVSHDPAKSGVAFEDTLELAEYCLTLPKLKLRGLMTIPKETKTFDEQRQEFHQLKKLYENLIAKGFVFDTLSMGMSEDWEAAVAEGATLIRIGTALFGPRI